MWGGNYNLVRFSNWAITVFRILNLLGDFAAKERRERKDYGSFRHHFSVFGGEEGQIYLVLSLFPLRASASPCELLS